MAHRRQEAMLKRLLCVLSSFLIVSKRDIKRYCRMETSYSVAIEGDDLGSGQMPIDLKVN